MWWEPVFRARAIGRRAGLFVAAAVTAWCPTTARPADATPGGLVALIRAVDSALPGLRDAASAVRTVSGDSAPADPDRLMLEATARPADLETGIRLASEVDAWHALMMQAESPWFAWLGAAEEPEKQRVRAAARSTIALAAAAAAVIDRAVDASDRALATGGEAPGEDRIALGLHLRQVVLPLRAGRAGVVLASCGGASSMPGLARLAVETAAACEPVSPWSESERLLVSALGLVLLDRSAEALPLFERAMRAGSGPDATAEVRDRVMLDASVGSAFALARARGPVTAREWIEQRLGEAPFRVEGVAALVPNLVAIEVLLTLAPAEASGLADGVARQAAIARPWEHAHRLAVGLNSMRDRAAAYARLGRRAAGRESLDHLPAIARVAAAWDTATGGGASASGVIERVDSLVDARRPPDDAVRRDAWWLFARAAVESDDPALLDRASDVGRTYAMCCADDEHAAEAVASAARAAEKRLRTARGVDAETAERDLLDLVRMLAGGGVRLDEAARDAWRLSLGRVILGLVRRGPLEAARGRASESALSLRQVVSGPERLEAEALLAETWSVLLRLALDDAQAEAMVHGLASELAVLTDPKMSRAASSDSTDPRRRDAMTVFRSEAWLALGRPADALAELERVIGPDADEAPVLTWEVALEASLALEHEVEARLAAERLPDAPRVLQRLSRRAWDRLRPLTEGFRPAGAMPTASSAVFRLAADAASTADERLAYQTRLGWALLLRGRTDAAQLVFEAAREEGGRDAMLLRGAGESFLASGDDTRAFAVFREVARGLESDESSPDYWHAWTRLLEILARRPGAPEHHAMIRREIGRLRSLDAALDQPECMVRIKAVEDALVSE